ncbi:MAG: DsrE family protein [Methanosarcina sp.]
MNAAAVSLKGMDVTLGLYGNGVYLAATSQDSRKLGVPNLADILYAYGESRVIVHEPSLVERGLFGEILVEIIELTNEEDFFRAIKRKGKVTVPENFYAAFIKDVMENCMHAYTF